MQGIVYLEDGSIYYGNGFGKVGTEVGELVFNTSMTGYQEIITDPSYAGQIITMTYPLIGNYGTNEQENESVKSLAKGFIVRSISNTPSNYLSEGSLTDMLIKNDIVGISGIDTRSITKKIRNKGAIKCVITTENLTIEELESSIKSVKLRGDWMKDASTKEIRRYPGSGLKVAIIDYGIKNNIIRKLKEYDCDITVYPYHSSYDDIIKSNPDGILLSNGPGDPSEALHGIDVTKKLIDSYPVFGICMGHQILALSLGANTYKMGYGHRGGNHGVYDVEYDKAFITSQNHGYAIDPTSIDNKDIVITHKNLNDDTIEGIRHALLPLFSVQFHPEGSPGPEDSNYLFDKFMDNMKGVN